jgi:hypothetical protein
MKFGFLTISTRCPHRSALAVTSTNAPIKPSIAVEHNRHGFDVGVTDRAMPKLKDLDLLHLQALSTCLPVRDMRHMRPLSD